MKKITHYERQIIEVELRKGKSKRAVARKLNRDCSVIRKEINRNSGKVLPYTADSAQRIANRSERSRHKKKLENDTRLKEYVIAELEKDHSPEQIAGQLKKCPLEHLWGKKLCHETIYQYIYNGEGRYEYLYPHLRRGRPKRKRQRARKPRKSLIPERISIHLRPDEINEKTRYGHWESDTMICKKQKEVLSTQYERKAQLVRLHKVFDKSAGETERAIRATIESLPQHMFRSMTFDNGGEGANHTKIRDDYGIDTYFCDGYASWQKGGVENINGLIRQYIPKNADLSKMTDDDIYVIQEKLNNRPRKNLNYLTPNEVIALEVGQ